MVASAGKLKAKGFLKTYKLTDVTADKLTEILKRQGYTIVEFG